MWLGWFGDAAKRPDGELIKDLLLPTPPGTWCRRTGDQLKTIRVDMVPFSGPRVFVYARWRKDWVKVSRKLAQHLQAWGASVCDLVNSIDDIGGRILAQVQVSKVITDLGVRMRALF